MPKFNINEKEIRRIAEKYVHTVSADHPANIQELITGAFKKIAPGRKVEHEDIASVVTHLSKRPKVSEKDIHEATKKVVDHSAVEDMKYMISRNIKAMGKRPVENDVTAIIKHGKLDPHSSSLQTIRDAVKGYYNKKPLEAHGHDEIQKIVHGEMQKNGPTDQRDIQSVVKKYLNTADQKKPIDVDDIRDIIKRHVPGLEPPPTIPQQSQVSRDGGKPTAPPQKPGADITQGDWVPPKDPKNPTFFEKIRLKMRRYGMRSLSRGSRNWLTDNVNRAKKTQARTKFLAEGETAAEALVGKMFMYFYDAKTKETLPYWDKFPLIFVVELYEDGWLGMNLHYLPLLLRIKLFDKLLQYADNKSLSRIDQLRLSYGLLKAVSQFPEVKPTLKRYLSEHVKSELLKIEPVDWEIAIFLPLQKFQKAPQEKVWSDSKRMIQQLKRRRR